MNNKILSILLILALSILCVHVIYTQTEGARADLTETKLYSLTDGTHKILEKMHDEAVKPVDIKLYFSYTTGKTLPKFIKNFITYEAYVRNLLREYERYSKGKLRISVIDPKPDSDDAEDAADYRLDGKQINSEGDKFYFGLVFETQTGSKDVIDFLWPEKQETIEYEISKKLHNLIWPAKKRIAVMSGLDPLPDNDPYMMQMMQMQGKQPPEPWTAMKVLEESYTVTRLTDVDTISKDDYDLLLVIHPKAFDDKQLWAINEWVVTGGDTLVFLDGYCLADQAPQNPQQPFAQLQYKPSSNLEPLLAAWGLKRTEDTFAMDYELGLKRPDRNGYAQKAIYDLVVDAKTAPGVLNQDLPIFQGIADLRFWMAGELEKLPDAKGTFVPLITTTEQGASMKLIPGFGGGDDLAFTDLGEPAKILARYSAEGKKTIGYMVTDSFASAYPDGATFPAETPQTPPGMPPGFKMPPPEDAEMITKEPLAADASAEARLVVYADVDFITNQVAFQNSIFGTQAVNDNYKVLLNTVDYLMGAKELMAVRAKENIRRPFERFDEIEASADRRMLEEEQRISSDIERFQEEVRQKQSQISEKNAGLFKKKFGEEVEELQAKIREGEHRLREIRKQKRGVLEQEESFIWYFVLLLMPLAVCAMGITSYLRRRSRQMSVRAES